ncbi:hypothetical protein JCM10908_003958 [Rhodotorula pacifica]|uniref:zinc-binding alcohol dehydrogenase family protein n=1 Tax=Rhodotorula pacifica TaxID=1495444 RepID=UPI00317AD28E
MTKNVAAWIPEPKAQLVVKEAPDWKAEKGEVVVKVHSVSIQPVDWTTQELDIFIKKYPFINGTDISGEVVEVGEGVNNVAKGDRVLGNCKGLESGEEKHGAFQKYAVVDSLLVAKIPDSISFDQATVLPLALTTASAGLYQSNRLNLPLPKPDAPNPEGKGKVILVYGGSSSVGTAAIQLAIASGLKVVTTCSPSNFDLVKSLGAVAAIDHRSDSLVADAVKAVEAAGSDFAGVFDAISGKFAVEKSYEIATKAFGGKGKLFVASARPPPEDLAEGVQAGGIYSFEILSREEARIPKAIWHDFVPQALANGTLQCKPDPLIVGKGLESIKEGFRVQKAGVSGQKVVVTGIDA